MTGKSYLHVPATAAANMVIISIAFMLASCDKERTRT